MWLENVARQVWLVSVASERSHIRLLIMYTYIRESLPLSSTNDNTTTQKNEHLSHLFRLRSNTPFLSLQIAMVKDRSKESHKTSTTDTGNSQQLEFNDLPPIVPEFPESPETSAIHVKVPGSTEVLAIEIHKVKQVMKRIIATGRTEFFYKWLEEEPYFVNKRQGVKNPKRYALRKAALVHFQRLFPGYIPVIQYSLTIFASTFTDFFATSTAFWISTNLYTGSS